MAWDDELDQLTRRVRDHFGDAIMMAALQRAITRTLRQAPGDVLALSGARITARDDTPGPHSVLLYGADEIPIDVFHEAFRRELRRLVRPH